MTRLETNINETDRREVQLEGRLSEMSKDIESRLSEISKYIDQLKSRWELIKTSFWTSLTVALTVSGALTLVFYLIGKFLLHVIP